MMIMIMIFDDDNNNDNDLHCNDKKLKVTHHPDGNGICVAVVRSESFIILHSTLIGMGLKL